MHMLGIYAHPTESDMVFTRLPKKITLYTHTLYMIPIYHLMRCVVRHACDQNGKRHLSHSIDVSPGLSFVLYIILHVALQWADNTSPFIF